MRSNVLLLALLIYFILIPELPTVTAAHSYCSCIHLRIFISTPYRLFIYYQHTYCGITRGHVVEGCCVPIPDGQPHYKMATMAHTTSPRMPHHSDRCRCFSHLIEAGLKGFTKTRTKGAGAQRAQAGRD